MKHLLKITAVFAVLILSNQAIPAQSKHYIDLWSGAGYSSVFHGIDNSTVAGDFGYNVGLGYRFEYDNFMFQLGCEFQRLNATTKLNYFVENQLIPYPYIPDHYITYHYNLNNYKEKHSVGYLNFPLKVGFKYLERYYALAGVGVGLNLSGNYRSSTMIETTATDPAFIEDWQNMPTHALGSNVLNDNGNLDFGLSVSPGLEVGVILDEWIYANQIRTMRRSKDAKLPPYSFRLGLFVDYDVVNINHSATDKKLLADPNPDRPQDLKLNGLLASSLADGKHVGSVLAGIKFTISFLVAETKPKPKPQLPLFSVQVNDSVSGKPMAAFVNLFPNKASKRKIINNKRTNSVTGIYVQKLRTGNYYLTVSEKDYRTFEDTVVHNEISDTFHVALQKIPYIYVDAIDAETGYPITAEIKIGNPIDQPSLIVVTDSLAEDISRYELEDGKYHYSATSPGYVYVQDTLNHSDGDTLLVVMETIKPEVVVVLKNLFFKWNSAIIEPESEPALNELLQLLNENPQMNIRIIGHTDNTGTEAYNTTLSVNRARAVVDWLLEKGISADRLDSEGRGEAEPVDTNDTDEGRANNRRVEFVIQKLITND